MRFTSADERNHYEIDGRLEVRQPPAPDPCQAAVDRVRAARAAVDGVQASIRSLQEELRSAPPSLKAGLIREIRRIRAEELPAAVAGLEAAQRALARCRMSRQQFADPALAVDPLVADRTL